MKKNFKLLYLALLLSGICPPYAVAQPNAGVSADKRPICGPFNEKYEELKDAQNQLVKVMRKARLNYNNTNESSPDRQIYNELFIEYISFSNIINISIGEIAEQIRRSERIPSLNSDEARKIDLQTKKMRTIFDRVPDPYGQKSLRSKIFDGLSSAIFGYSLEKIISLTWDYFFENNSKGKKERNDCADDIERLKIPDFI